MACSRSLLYPLQVLPFAILLLSLICTSFAADTDTITWGGDVSRCGYQPNHNMDPAVVGSANFGQIFKASLPGNFNGMGPEQIFSQPLVYTGTDGVQYIYVATTQNNVYKLNAKTGAIVASRNLHVPFLTADLNNCVDINPLIGVTATGVIDSSTGIWYLTAKTYSQQFQDGNFGPTSKPGLYNARYYFHAIHTEDLTEVSGFPTLIDGTIFRNNPNRMFIGGIQHNRPGLLQVGDYIYTGWASHCVLYNFTGAIIGFNKNTGKIVEAFALEAGPEPNTVPGAGVWMSGGGLAYDGRGSMYFASGNGYASQLKPTGNSLPGRNPPSTLALEEAAVNAKINDDGTIMILDFFMPWEKTALDGADKDLGTSPLELLPSDTFSCPNQKRIGVVTGKSGKTYWLNLDNLGGYQMGPNKLDAAIQVFQNENSVYAGAAVMPLGGGYIYINVIKYQTHVFKFGCDGSGNAVFTHVSDTAEQNAAILGVGHGTTTSLNGQDGTGLVWISDVEGENLRIYSAIPSGANLAMINAFNIPGVTKFTRPVFGDGRVYIGTTQGYLYGFGSPVNLPLNCSSPYQFTQAVAVGNSSAPLTINCRANIATTIIALALTGNPNFVLSNVPSTPKALQPGDTFSFQAAFAPRQMGPLSSDVIVNTTNSVPGYSVNTPITLKGTANSVAPVIAIMPNTVSFNVLAGFTATQPFTISNLGDSTLNIFNISYSLESETGPWDTPNISSQGVQLGYFTFTNIPSTISGDSAVSVPITYSPGQPGVHKVFVLSSSDGGSAVIDVVGVAGTNPVALIEFEKPDGSGWITYESGVPFSFGNVTEGQTRYLRIRVTNNGSSSAIPLSLTVSKPPYGLPGVVGAVNDVDLTEGTDIQAGQSQTATLYCSVPKTQDNLPSYSGNASWIMNTGDPNMGKQTIQFFCEAVSPQVGPLLPNGTAQYPYVGCFKENNPGRQLAIQAYGDPVNNTNGRCVSNCYSQGYKFAGTQYTQECWCGNAIPVQIGDDTNCNFQCTGNMNETCGGNGIFYNESWISLFADSTKFNGNTTSSPLHMVQSVGNYNFIGCYAETGAKTVSEKSTTSDIMTVEYCAAFCRAFEFFGLEYARECYCGGSLSSSSTLTDLTQCSMSCKGSNSEYCGGGSRMQMYQTNGTAPTFVSASGIFSTSTSFSPAATTLTTSMSLANYTFLGCYNETHDRRALNGNARGGVSYNTLESCAAFCFGFSYFGVEYGSECYCANSIYSNSVLQPTNASCNMPCSGNSSEICGAGDFLSVYYTSVTVAPLSMSSSASGPVPTSTGPVVVSSAGPYISLGCYNEIPGRALTAQAVANNSMTVELCAAFCFPLQFLGVEYGDECYCGNALPTTSQLVMDGRCSMPCAANGNEICGGPNGLSLYQLNPNATSSTSSAAFLPQTAKSASSGFSTMTRSISPSVVTSSTAAIGSASLTSRTPTPTQSLTCPASNGTVYKSSSGVSYLIECFLDRDGNDFPMVYTNTLELCIVACDQNSGCKDVSWVVGGPCYLKGAVRSGAPNGNVWGAQLLPASTVTSGASHFSSPSVASSFSASPSIALSSTSGTSSTISSQVLTSTASGSGSSSSLGSTPLRSQGVSSSVAPSAPIMSSMSSSMVLSVSSSTISTSAFTTTSASRGPNPASSSGTSSGIGAISSISQSTSQANSISSSSITMQSSSISSTTSVGMGADGSMSNSALRTSTGVSSTETSSTSSIQGVASSQTMQSSSRSVSSPTSNAPTAVPSVSSYVYQGCYSEAASGRALSALTLVNGTSMTPALCAAACNKWAWFGVEYAQECYCGPSPNAGSLNVTNQADCSKPCVGDHTALCGGSNRLTMYFSSNSSKISKGPAVVQNVGNYSFYNCIVDNGNPRALPTRLSTSTMTIEVCMAAAESNGYEWAGVEYGQECWMGNTLASNAINATQATDCSMPCPGNGQEICGAGARLTLYKRNQGV